jgi:hypothetical protein
MSLYQLTVLAGAGVQVPIDPTFKLSQYFKAPNGEIWYVGVENGQAKADVVPELPKNATLMATSLDPGVATALRVDATTTAKSGTSDWVTDVHDSFMNKFEHRALRMGTPPPDALEKARSDYVNYVTSMYKADTRIPGVAPDKVHVVALTPGRKNAKTGEDLKPSIRIYIEKPGKDGKPEFELYEEKPWHAPAELRW